MRRDEEILLRSANTGRQIKIHVRALDTELVEILRAWRRFSSDERWKSAPDLLGTESLELLPSIPSRIRADLRETGAKREKARP